MTTFIYETIIQMIPLFEISSKALLDFLLDKHIYSENNYKTHIAVIWWEYLPYKCYLVFDNNRVKNKFSILCQKKTETWQCIGKHIT